MRQRGQSVKNYSACGRRVGGAHVSGGFTLIELMIAVLILGVLAAIAIPSYQEHVRKSRRAVVTADLSEIAQRLERHHTVNNTYVGFNLPFDESPRDGVAFYTIELDDVTRTAFTLTATRTGAQVADERCGDFELRHTGQKTATGSWGTDRCW